MSAPQSDPAFLAPEPSGSVAVGTRPTFSVVIAVWQSAATVAAAVRGALDQTEPPLEIVVCDDGSTDDVAAALAPFGEAVRLVRIPHSGASVARNTAATYASGDFLAILDADDAWHPRRLERLADLAASRPDLDLLTTDAWFVVDGRRRGRFYDAAGEFHVRAQATEILRRNFFFAHVAVRRSVWERHGGFTAGLEHANDWDFWLRLLASGCRAGCVAEPLADYTIHSRSLSADRSASLLARVSVLDRASASLHLSNEQQEVLTHARGEYLRRARGAAAECALVENAANRRGACWQLARTPGVPLLERLGGVAAVVAPGYAGRRLRRRRERAGRAWYDRVIPGQP